MRDERTVTGTAVHGQPDALACALADGEPDGPPDGPPHWQSYLQLHGQPDRVAKLHHQPDKARQPCAPSMTDLEMPVININLTTVRMLMSTKYPPFPEAASPTRSRWSRHRLFVLIYNRTPHHGDSTAATHPPVMLTQRLPHSPARGSLPVPPSTPPPPTATHTHIHIYVHAWCCALLYLDCGLLTVSCLFL